MNDNDMKRLPAEGLSLDPFRACVLDKLEKNGWCADFSGFGEGKAEKAMLCVLDLLTKKEKANVLILCPDRFAHSWYGAALLRLGLEFKIVSAAKDSVYFFSPCLSNLFIIPVSVLSEEETPVLADLRGSGIVWDLTVADASGKPDGTELSVYEKLGMKAEKALLFAPYPASYDASPSQVPSVIQALLKNGSGEFPPITPETTVFSADSPYLNYSSSEENRPVIRPISYEVDPKRIPKNLRFEDSQVRYASGGNIFEEYNLEERKIYLRPVYTHTEAEILKNTDAKLKAFLDVIDPIIRSEDKTAVVYFNSDATLQYVEKILAAVYYEKRSGVTSITRTGYNLRRMKQWFGEEHAQKLRVVLMKDEADELFPLYSPITHIISYELPDHPAVLQQRYKRRALVGGKTPEFIFFCDTEGLFDGRVLKKALAGNLYKAFRRELPCENILLRIEGIEQILTDLLIDVKYIADYTGSVGSSFDVISRFKSDYMIPAERNLTTAARTHEYAAHKLSVLAAMLGVSALAEAKETDKAALFAAVTEKVNALRGGYASSDGNNALSVLPYGTTENDEFRRYSEQLGGNPYMEGIGNARAELKTMAEEAGGYAYLKDKLSELSDLMRPIVLYHVWLYWHKELGYGGAYGEFIQAYNDGLI